MSTAWLGQSSKRSASIQQHAEKNPSKEQHVQPIRPISSPSGRNCRSRSRHTVHYIDLIGLRLAGLGGCEGMRGVVWPFSLFKIGNDCVVDRE